MSPDALHARIEHDMTNHAPEGQWVIDRFELLRQSAKQLAHTMIDLCPQGRELSTALTSVEQSVMYAVAAIARNQAALGLPEV